MGVGSFSLPINAPLTQFEYPSDWVSITGVPDNEIYLTTADLALGSVAFTVTTSTGTYNVDWGDGNSTTGITSNTIAQYQYTYGTGLTGTTLPGVTTFRCRIYATSGTITRFFVSRNTNVLSFQPQAILAANFGTTGLTSFANAFSSSTTVSTGTTICQNLRVVYLPTSLDSVTTMASAFGVCDGLERVDMPISMTGCTSYASTFIGCRALSYIKLPNIISSSGISMTSIFENCNSLYRVDYPTNGNSIQAFNRAHINNLGLVQLNLPSTMTGINNTASTFELCVSLQSLTLPTGWPGIGNRTFLGCTGLVELTLPTSCASLTDSSFNGCTSLQKVVYTASSMPQSAAQQAFDGCRSLKYFKYPATLNTGNTNFTFKFQNCNNLVQVDFPTTLNGGGDLRFLGSYFRNCTNLRVLNNFSTFGSLLAGGQLSNGDNFITNNLGLTGITFNQRWSRLDCIGTSTLPQNITSIRFTNTTAGQWTGSSPHINISWNSLGQAALVDVFNDLPVVVSKVINITGNPGAALLTPAEEAIATGKGWSIIK